MSGVSKAVKALVKERANNSCERCGGDASGVHSYHHRRPRGMGGSKTEVTNDPANIMLLCGSGVTGCHGEVESARRLSLDQGWLVSQYEPFPTSVPVLYLMRDWVLLLPDGGMRAA